MTLSFRPRGRRWAHISTDFPAPPTSCSRIHDPSMTQRILLFPSHAPPLTFSNLMLHSPSHSPMVQFASLSQSIIHIASFSSYRPAYVPLLVSQSLSPTSKHYSLWCSGSPPFSSRCVSTFGGIPGSPSPFFSLYLSLLVLLEPERLFGAF